MQISAKVFTANMMQMLAVAAWLEALGGYIRAGHATPETSEAWMVGFVLAVAGSFVYSIRK